MFWFSSSRTTSSASSFSGLSSTSRILTLESSIAVGAIRVSPCVHCRKGRHKCRPYNLPIEPHPQQRQKLLGIHRLGDVVARAGFDALLAVALHRLGGQRDDRKAAV